MLGLLLSIPAAAADLPHRYFQLLDAGITTVMERLSAEPASRLRQLEARPGWRHFPSAVLVAAVLYTKSHPGNPRHRDPEMFEAALRIGDVLAAEADTGDYRGRLDHHRDTYMWLEAYRLLEKHLDEARRARWRQALIEQLSPLAAEVRKRQDYPWYNSPFIITSPNHYSLWSSTVYLAGRVFRNKEWEQLGARVMHRFAAEEQTPDGYWGEHSRAGPTTGYDYLTTTGVALYWEHSRDPAALEALRRSTDFHKFFTYSDGTPVETINDRNRYWRVPVWGHFGFSNFADGRRYAQFLTSHYDTERFSLEALGRMAQNALYFHEGSVAPIPQDQPHYVHQMSVPAGIRKSGPWVTCLSGLISTSTLSRFYLDRQSSLSVFHEELGLIVSGANSKHQPELATFSEKIDGQVFHLPMSSRLEMGEDQDRLALAYHRFFSLLTVPNPSEKQVTFRFVITPKGRMAETLLTLQLRLRTGLELQTAAGRKIVLGEEKIELGPDEIGAWIGHNGWILRTAAPMRLVWPVYPFNPYANAPETSLEQAVGAYSTPLAAGAQAISFTLEAKL